MTILKTILSIAVVAGVSACSSSNPATVTPGDVDAAVAKLGQANGLAVTATESMPTSGTATYTGQLGFEFSGDEEGGALADLSMTADFASGAITGEATNVNILGDDIEDQRLDGTLNIAGTVAGTSLNAAMTGALSGAASGIGFDTTADLTLAGDFRSSNPGTTEADVISGTVSGSLSGDLDITVLSGDNNGFYACMPNCTAVLP